MYNSIYYLVHYKPKNKDNKTAVFQIKKTSFGNYKNKNAALGFCANKHHPMSYPVFDFKKEVTVLPVWADGKGDHYYALYLIFKSRNNEQLAVDNNELKKILDTIIKHKSLRVGEKAPNTYKPNFDQLYLNAALPKSYILATEGKISPETHIEYNRIPIYDRSWGEPSWYNLGKNIIDINKQNVCYSFYEFAVKIKN